MGGGGPQGPGGFRQDYHAFFRGLTNLLQIASSGIGLVSFGKMFGVMVWKLIKNICSKSLSGVKYIGSLIFLNRVSMKIIGGALKRGRSVSDSKSIIDFLMKSLFAIGVLALTYIGFSIKRLSAEETESKLIEAIQKRKLEEESKLKEKFSSGNIYLISIRLGKWRLRAKGRRSQV